MYAIVKLGGVQRRASVGDVLKVEKIDGNVGDRVEISDVLLLGKDEGTVVGAPSVAGARVLGEIVAQGRNKTVLVMKMKRRKGYRRKVGHRQLFTKIRITEVVAP